MSESINLRPHTSRIKISWCETHGDGCRIVLNENFQEIAHVDINCTDPRWIDHVLDNVYADIGDRALQECRERLPAILAGFRVQPSMVPQSTIFCLLPSLSFGPDLAELDFSKFELAQDKETEDHESLKEEPRSNEDRLADLQLVPLLDRDDEYDAELRKIEIAMEHEYNAAAARKDLNYTFEDRLIELQNTQISKRDDKYWAEREHVKASMHERDVSYTPISIPNLVLDNYTTNPNISVYRDGPRFPPLSPAHAERELPPLTSSSSAPSICVNSRRTSSSDSPRRSRPASIIEMGRAPIKTTSKFFKKMFKKKKPSEPIFTVVNDQGPDSGSESDETSDASEGDEDEEAVVDNTAQETGNATPMSPVTIFDL